MPSLDWRKIESALERVARSWGWSLDRITLSADIIANAQRLDDLNLTALAKDLADELNS